MLDLKGLIQSTPTKYLLSQKTRPKQQKQKKPKPPPPHTLATLKKPNWNKNIF